MGALTRGLIWIMVALLLLLAAGAVAAVWWTERYVQTPLPVEKPQILEVPRGRSFAAVANDLAERNLVSHPLPWILYARARGLAPRIQAGEYEIRPGATPASVLDRLVRGEVILRSITIVEGATFRDLLRTLEREPRLKQTLHEMTDEEIMAALGAPGVHPEGQFFPDTYHFAAQTADIEILKKAHAQMRQHLAAAWEARAPELPLNSPYEALILASIVEKETALAAERPRIAGVFIRRLRLGWRLQSDPTVIYGLGEAYDGDIRTRDLRGDTPYNTYTRSGLPPTPIALPGEESLRAVTRPEDSGALYFVASGEPDGSHYFSRTLDEHSAAVRRYLQRTRGR